MEQASILSVPIKTSRHRLPGLGPRRIAGLVSGLAAVAILGVIASSPALAASTRVNLTPGAGAPNATGKAQIDFDDGVLKGSVRVEDLPAQAFGSGRFYGTWFVRTDTGDKAFLGALVNQDSIIFSEAGAGQMRFAATKFTTGPHANSPIALGPDGTNLLIVLIENNINGLTPSPVGPVPGVGVAASGTF